MIPFIDKKYFKQLISMVIKIWGKIFFYTGVKKKKKNHLQKRQRALLEGINEIFQNHAPVCF